MGLCTITVVDLYSAACCGGAIYKRNNDDYLPPEERNINFKNDIKKVAAVCTK